MVISMMTLAARPPRRRAVRIVLSIIMSIKAKPVLIAAVAAFGAASAALAQPIPGDRGYRLNGARVDRSLSNRYHHADGRRSELHSFVTVPSSSDFEMQLRMDREDF
jgi:hypothetical protein